MTDFPPLEHMRDLIRLAVREDLGSGDITSQLLIPERAMGVGTLIQREVGIACGLPIIPMILPMYDERLRLELIPGFHLEVIEGRFSDARQTPLARIRGPLRALLSAERIILNFLQRLSGVATHTQRFVKRIEGTAARIYDTRKTTPGLRLLEKYAVRRGGGHNHRMGLHDGILVKDNHLAGIPIKELAGHVGRIVESARSAAPGRFVEVEVDTLEQFGEVLKVGGIQIILLDNMDCPTMARAVELRNAAGKQGVIELEASGGVTLQTVPSVAQTGVERIAVGAITHSAPALDISLDIEA